MGDAVHKMEFREKAKTKQADNVLRELEANELIFAVVGPAGSGTSEVAGVLEGILHNEKYQMDVQIIKASGVIEKWATDNSKPIDLSTKLLRARSLQDLGDDMRKSDPAAVAVGLVAAVREVRTQLISTQESTISITASHKKRRAFILDSLKHPAEVELLRSIYKDAFCLIGVVCELDERKKRLKDVKCKDSSSVEVDNFIKRDEDAEIKYGQKVADTFHLADFFVDNSPSRLLDRKENPLWEVPNQLARLIDLLTHTKIIRPTPSETGMFHAYGAKMRSACLSRQVGAALLDSQGNVIATGTNEVPRAGGGVYGGNFDHDELNDHRCGVVNEYCSNTKMQLEIIKEIVDEIPELQGIVDPPQLMQKLKKTSVGRLLEFSRAVHAEMDALITAARQGVSTVGTRLFVTTFPCHYCARHIVSAGVDEVQYIEPYPKSRAIKLHGDAITQSPGNWEAPSMPGHSNNPSKVLFRSFTGIAPRLYRQVFLKDRDLKDSSGNFHIGESYTAAGLLRLSYQDIEKVLIEKEIAE